VIIKIIFIRMIISTQTGMTIHSPSHLHKSSIKWRNTNLARRDQKKRKQALIKVFITKLIERKSQD
jgi:hypothetical protein